MKAGAFCVALLFAFINGTNSSSRTELIKKCRYEGNMCSIDTSCFSDLHKVGLLTYCDEFPIGTPKKNEHIDEALSFTPEEYVLEEDMPPDVTYSVVLSADYTMDNLIQLPGCCNLDPNDKNDTCRMNATFDQKKKFNVVFPFKKDSNPYEPLYCRYRIAYDKVHYKFCKDDEEIVEPCLTFTNDGEVRIKYRYTSLTTGTSKSLNTSRCYFTVSKENIPQDKANAQGSFEVTDPSFLKMEKPQTAIVRDVTHTCQMHSGVVASHNAIAANIYQETGGDFICCGLKALSVGQDHYYPNILCTSTQIWRIEIPILPIVVPVSVFLALLLLIASVRSWKIYRKVTKNKEHSPKLADQHDGDENRQKIIYLDPVNDTVPMENVDEIEFNKDDDCCNMDDTAAWLQTTDEQGFGKCDNAKPQSSHDEHKGTNQNEMEKSYIGSADSGYGGGTSSDFGYLLKSNSATDLLEIPSPGNTSEDFDAALHRKHQDLPIFADNKETAQ